jgi:hypothetical protein
VLYLLHRDARPAVVRDTLTVCFLGLSILGAIALFVTGTSGARPEGTWLAALVPVVAIGHLAGRPVFARIAHGHYEGVLTGVLLVACAAGLVTALV